MSYLNPELILNYLTIHGYFALFFICIFEGPLTSILAGFLCSIGIFKISVVYFILVFSDITGDILAFSIGYLIRKDLLKFLKISKEKINFIEEFFKENAGKTIFISKFIIGLGSWALISASAAGVKAKRFFSYCIPVSFVKSIILIGIGYFFGEMYSKINTLIDTSSTIFFVLAIILILYFLTKKKIKHHFKEKYSKINLR